MPAPMLDCFHHSTSMYGSLFLRSPTCPSDISLSSLPVRFLYNNKDDHDTNNMSHLEDGRAWQIENAKNTVQDADLLFLKNLSVRYFILY